MDKLFLVCYDISCPKRARKVRKLVYSMALGGQKSALESYLSLKEAEILAEQIHKMIDPRKDRVNIIEVYKEVMLFGRAKNIPINENGDIII